MIFIKYSIAILLFFNWVLSAQTIWQKHPSNPVLQTGSPGLWDANGVFAPSVVFDGSNFKMYYSGYNGFNYQIGLANSDDKINWTRHASVPVLDYGTPGSWDSRYVSQPSVIFENGIYKMWYTGWSGGGLETFKIGYAISSNGTNWDKYDFNPVFSASTIGNWDPLGVFSPSVIFRNGIYHMWFTGHNGSEMAIGYATSVDGINWNWYQGNPVLEGEPGKWDEEAGHCEVLQIGGYFLMWYTGFKADTSSIGYAQSTDGINWDKYSGNPVLTTVPNSWEQLAIDEPNVLYDSSYLHMWYSGFDSGNHSQIGYAFEITIDVNENQNNHLQGFKLYQNYPNPFNPSTKIKFTIPQTVILSPTVGRINSTKNLSTLKVYDVLGNEITTLINEELLPGEYEVQFDSNTLDGWKLPSGVYYYQLKTSDFNAVRKMILLH